MQTGIVLQVGGTPTLNVALGLGDLERDSHGRGGRAARGRKKFRHQRCRREGANRRASVQGRQVTDLIVLAGAAVATIGQFALRGRPRAVAQSRSPAGFASASAYFLDGALHNDPYNNLNLPLPFPDALQEFRVATSGLTRPERCALRASVNAVTKSGTNRVSGNAFEFLRDHRFNATNPFAAVGPDGKRQDDGLSRNQSGGTLGGPIVQNRLFFFGAYQGDEDAARPADLQAWVPTAAMLAGDFTAFASPACNGGRQIALRAPFVNNRLVPLCSVRRRSTSPRSSRNQRTHAARSPTARRLMTTSGRLSPRSTTS